MFCVMIQRNGTSKHSTKYQIHPQHIFQKFLLYIGTAASRVDLQCDDVLLSVNSISLTHTPLNRALVILQEVLLHVFSNAHSCKYGTCN